VFADEALEILPADYWRFALIRMRPEQKDISFNWAEFYRIVNTEMNDDIGNFIHRATSFVWSRYGGVVPEARAWDKEDEEIREQVRQTAESVIELMYEVQLKSALERIVELARKSNQYFNAKAPWDSFKNDRERCDTTMYVSINIARSIGVLLAPFVPESSARILKILNLSEVKPGEYPSAAEFRVPAGHRINKPEPVFSKLPSDFLEKIDEIVLQAKAKAESKRPKV